MAGNRPQSNFTHLNAHDEQLVRLGVLAERYFAEDGRPHAVRVSHVQPALHQEAA